VSDDSKIERNGQWTLEPLGHIIVEGGVAYIKIDALINIDYDETKVYAKDNNNNWILVTEYAFSGMPNSDLGFNFSDAVNGGTTSNVVDQFGNIEWTLILYIAD
jgi:hypothetical protein